MVAVEPCDGGRADRGAGPPGSRGVRGRRADCTGGTGRKPWTRGHLVSERWDAGPNGGDDWDGWGSGRTAAQSPRSSLRRHSQPRDADDLGFPEPGFRDGTDAPLPAALPMDGDTGGQTRLPGHRRPDPSSFDPHLTSLAGPLAADDPRAAHSALFAGPPLDLDLQPGSRLRVGPRHGAGERNDSERAPKS